MLVQIFQELVSKSNFTFTVTSSETKPLEIRLLVEYFCIPLFEFQHRKSLQLVVAKRYIIMPQIFIFYSTRLHITIFCRRWIFYAYLNTNRVSIRH